MKIEVNIDKKHFIILSSLIAIFGVVLVTNAYGSNQPDVMGHSWDEIEKPADYADDADSDPTNELQDLNNVLSRGNNAGGKKITNLGDPTSSSDAATRQFVLDNLENGGINENNCYWTSYTETGASTGRRTCEVNEYMKGIQISKLHNCDSWGSDWECDRVRILCCKA